MYKGLCLIPEGRNNKEYIGKKSEIYNVSIIRNLDTYLSYANRSNLGVLYLSSKYGLVYADEILEGSKTPLYKYSSYNVRMWSRIVSEQVLRVCLDYMVSEVHIMINRKGCYRFLMNDIKVRGIKVYTPYMR